MKSEVVTTYNLLACDSEPEVVPYAYWRVIVSGDQNYNSLVELAGNIKDKDGYSHRFYAIERVDKTREVLEL